MSPLQKHSIEEYPYGTRVELLRSVWIQDPSKWQFILNHEGPLRGKIPKDIKRGTIGVIGDHIPGVPVHKDSYTVMLSIHIASDEVACVRVLVDKRDIRIPQAKILTLPRGVMNGKE